MPGQALSDLKVLEFGNFVSAPYTGKLLADMGAEVIKVEEPPQGDVSRRHGPFPEDIPHPEKSGLFLYLNTNKMGVTLNHRTPSGRNLLLDLVKKADVLVENHMPREMKAWGLDFDTLIKVNPRLIMTSVTVFGQTGPYKDYKGHAIGVVSAAGLAYRMGDPAREPLASPLSRGDYFGAINAASATLLAAAGRRKTGRGQHVDISSAECFSTIMSTLNTIDYVDEGFYPSRGGTRNHAIMYPWMLLPCKDGFYSFYYGTDRHWQRLVELMGNPEWSKNPRYQTRDPMGKEYPEEVDELVKPWVSQWTKKQLWEQCRARDIPWHPIQTMDEVCSSDQLKERDYFVNVSHPETGPLKQPGAPYKFSQTPWAIRKPAPRLGEHNCDVYCYRLGLSKNELVTLGQAGVI